MFPHLPMCANNINGCVGTLAPRQNFVVHMSNNAQQKNGATTTSGEPENTRQDSNTTSASQSTMDVASVLPRTKKQWGQMLLLVVLTLLTTSLAVTISLMWNSAVQDALNKIKWTKGNSKFIVAGIVTIAGVLVTMLFVVLAAWAGVALPGTTLSTSAENVAG